MNKGKKAESTEKKVAWGAMPLHLDEPQSSGRKKNYISVLTFTLNGELLAIHVEHTEGVVECPRISPLPSPPDPIIGVASVRGRMAVVIDLSPNRERKATKRRLILIKGEAQIGLLADRVEGVIALSRKKIRAVSDSNSSRQDLTLKGGLTWLATSFFKSEGLRVPIIDVQRLADM